MIIDAHQHFWKLDRGDYFWMSPDLGRIYRDYGPDDLRGHLVKGGVSKTVLVQAADSTAETLFMLQIAAKAEFVAGVVGWVGLDQRDSITMINRLRAKSMLKGLRPMLQDIKDTDWITKAPVLKSLAHLEEVGLRFDALVQPRHLEVLLEVAQRFPKLQIVVDHVAKPVMGNGALPDPAWKRGMRNLAALPNVYCKLSGMATEAGRGWKIDDLRPFSDVVLDAFGPSKLMWGSDWPVAEMVTEYDTWLDTAWELTEGLSSAEQKEVFGGTAQRFYGL